jgi:hypothetical protein
MAANNAANVTRLEHENAGTGLSPEDTATRNRLASKVVDL